MNLNKIIFILIFISTAAYLHAESVFIKDGSIIEGKIIKETDASATVDTGWGKTRDIPRRDILRIIFDTDYKNIKYIHKKNGEVIEGYIVNENFENYVYRIDLKKPAELIIYKYEVNFVSKIKLNSGKDKTAQPEQKQLFNRLLGFKIGPFFAINYSTNYPNAMFNPGFDLGIMFYDRIFEFEMNGSIFFSGINSTGNGNAQVSYFSRLNSNFIFGNIFGFGIGYFITDIRNELSNAYPNANLFLAGMSIGPVLRVPDKLHVSFLVLIPFGSNLNYRTLTSTATFSEKFNFNFLIAVDIFIWKTLSVGFSYTLLGGDYYNKNESSQSPLPYTNILFYSHQVTINVGYSFNL